MEGGKIRILGGSLAGMEVPVSARVILGRDPTKAQIVFPSEDMAVSRRHCEIQFDSADSLFEVRDLGSRNGTFVTNGSDPPRRLAPDVAERLAPGQYILVGSSRNRLALELDRARLVDDVQRHANADQNVEAGWIPLLAGLLPGGDTAVLTLLISVAIAVVGIIIVFFVLSLVGLDKSIAGTAAKAIIGGIPYLRDSLDKSGLLRARRTHRTVLSFDGFGLSPQKLILNGTLILFAAMNLSAALVGVARAGSALDFKTIALVATTTSPAARRCWMAGSVTHVLCASACAGTSSVSTRASQPELRASSAASNRRSMPALVSAAESARRFMRDR